ncbi:MAG: hypothetical protein BGO24_10885 [Sphingomonas sp. 67-36]|uniref:hypothetical protein n=2 Tax=unclassified Sphingomonas TaxID=196159 RepID=UPI00092BEABE|nr:hypothetical protein [Sphingomonas sp.]MBN8847212.1 hypothetical protein [Sphingomonas sp.]OJV33913.1 MAG: hypothetical protein BGO24_10885 [Sphingomonas sp. 67-36]
MLAGLLFAVQDAEDRPGRLAATLPFAGVTLIEYQARLLAAAGASQLVIVVSRLTPELLGAIARIGRRGMSVDTVRGAAEANARLHPLAQVVTIADGLITTESVLAAFAGEQGSDALLVIDAGSAPADYERLGGGLAWAGIARIDARRLAEVAAMPSDYDVQSALLHAASQAGARQVLLPAGGESAGHGIERRGAALEERSRAVVMATLATRPSWFDRWVVRPIAGFVLPPLVRRAASTVAVAAGAGVAALAGLGLIAGGWPATGLLAALAGVIAAVLGERTAWLRDEMPLARWLGRAALAVPALAALLLGYSIDSLAATGSALILAIALIAVAALGERAASGRARAFWWGTPPAYLLVLTALTLARLPMAGLALAALYAFVTLSAAIELLRRQA